VVESEAHSPRSGKGHRSLNVEGKGNLVFQDDVSTESRLSYMPSLRAVLALRVSLVSCVLVLYGLLMATLLDGTLTPVRALILLFCITIVLVIDSQASARSERGAKPVKIYDKGIEMPTTWFERNLFKRGFVRWEDVGTIFAVRHNAREEMKIVRGVETEIVLVTRDGVTYSTFAKDRIEVRKALKVILGLWPRLADEMTRIERLEEKGTGFSRGFGSVTPMSLLIPAVVLLALLTAALGMSVMTATDISITIFIIIFIVVIDMAFGYLLARVGRAKSVLMGSLQESGEGRTA